MSSPPVVPAGDGVVEIVVPVYKGFDATRTCLRSVLSATAETPFDVVVVDDCSPDPELSAWLDELAARGEIVLIRNERNLGFVASVNRGLAQQPQRDVVILNSDTEVCGSWLDRLVECARRQPQAGTVTPFSNNASICSYPVPCSENALPVGWTLSDLDAAFARANAGCVAELPTGVGFCMFIRRSCWEHVGGFDEARFGAGYGEENDFCMRARAAGWQNLVAADTFVYHKGSESFGDSRFERMQRAEETVQALHPDYGTVVSAFVREDPLDELRGRASAERARRSHQDAIFVLEEFLSARRAREALMAGWLDFAEDRAQTLQNECKFLQQALNEARQHGEELTAALAQAERFVREREEDVARLSADVALLRAENAALSGNIAMLRDSLRPSWLMRAIARVFRAMRK